MIIKDILLTKTIESSLLKKIEKNGLVYEICSFISIKHREIGKEIINLLEDDNYKYWIFTSSNSIQALKSYLRINPECFLNKQIICAGSKTASLMKNIPAKVIVPNISGFKGVIQVMEDVDPKEKILYFAGNIRRDELPDYMKKRGMDFREVILYDTVKQKCQLGGREFKTILFYSPSAVEAYFDSGNNPGKSMFFAIGDTTANEIKRYVANPVFYPDEQSSEALVNMVIKYLSKKNTK